MPRAVNGEFDRTNAFVAAMVWLISFIVYALTVQPTFSFWDCGEFVACARILGIPHPPGTPLFVLIGRVFSIIPFVDDIGHRVNYMSVISSAFTAMFSYLLASKLIRYFFDRDRTDGTARLISYVGGFAGAFFVAFGSTNWNNSVEAEVYGLALALSVAIVYLTLIYWERRGTPGAARYMILAMFLALLGVGIHMTVFLVVPVCALFFMFKREASQRDWMLVCGFVIIELLMIILLANGRGGVEAFYAVTALLGAGLLAMLWRKVNWAIIVAVGASATLMVSFSMYLWAFVIGLFVLIVLALLSKQQGWDLQWKAGLAILVIGFAGMSVHAYIPIRSGLNPRIDENNPSRDFRTFMNYLDRKQYGQMGMVERMFNRRGTWTNQFGRHPHMGFWSYFEEQWSPGGWAFLIPLFLGLIGMVTAIRKRLELGLPFMTLFLVCSVGLILYMNFADGTQYSLQTGDAYLEVRNRDYFFTPAFVFFGIAMGLGVAAIIQLVRDAVAGDDGMRRNLVYAGCILGLLPFFSMSHNWHYCDRSGDHIPYLYAKNILDTCEKDAILFTSGDNDTFPLWAMQEVYNYRRDVRVANLSLLNTDWYVEQMKTRYDVPISLDVETQIRWNPVEVRPGEWGQRPEKPFFDRARQQNIYMVATPTQTGVLKVQDMMVDEIVYESTRQAGDSLYLKTPIYFSSPPYAESPLRLREFAQSVGILYRLDWNRDKPRMDTEATYDFIMNKYRYDGYENSEVFRDENATGVFLTMGVNGLRLFDILAKGGDTARALEVGHKLTQVYPEYWQTYLNLGEVYDARGQRETTDSLWWMLHDTLQSFTESNPFNLFYMQDFGLAKLELGQRLGDQKLTDDGVQLLWDAFLLNKNSGYSFRKLASGLSRTGQFTKVTDAALLHAEYPINLNDPYLQQILGMTSGMGGASVP